MEYNCNVLGVGTEKRQRGATDSPVTDSTPTGQVREENALICGDHPYLSKIALPWTE